MRNSTDGGDAILQAFRSLNVDYVMSSPGSEWGPVWEAMAHQQLHNEPGPVYLTCAHETLAVDLAMGYTQITGRMQAVMLHTGVGLLQGSMGIEGALRGAIPMVILSGEALSFGDDPEMDPGFQWQGILNQVGGPARLVEPLVKWSNQAGSIATLHQQIVSAGEMAQRTPRAPVYMSVPIEVMKQPWAAPESLRTAPDAPILTATQDDIAAFAKRLSEAECPVIIAEEAGRTAEGFHALVALAEKLAIPVVEGKFAPYSNFPRNHPLFLGAGRPAVIDEADLVVTVSCRQPWYPLKDVPKRAHVLAIDDTPFRDHVVYQPSAAEQFLEGDVAANLAMLAAAVTEPDADTLAARRKRWDDAVAQRAEDNAAAIAKDREADTISPSLLFAALNAATPDDAIYVDETITHRPFLMRHLEPRGPLSYFRVHGGLGQAMGVALGVKLGAGERMVVTTMGDGTFLYNPAVQAMAFAKKHELATLTVVTNNHGYNAMRKDQMGYYPDGVAAETGLYLGHPITEFEYSDLAAPFGAYGGHAATPAELDTVLAEAIEAVKGGRPALVNVSLNA